MTSQGVKRKVVTVSDFRFTGRLLGKGNFARVEEAIHTVLNVKVAIKVIDIRNIKEQYVVKNLHREAKILAKLNHPCIATLFQTMQVADHMYYLVTELVEGGDLCSCIIAQRYGKLDERLARIYARQFTSALSHMHSFGIVHRDLKMENVMMNTARTHIKIVDFGLSNVWTKDNPLRTHCGSPEYAAPELFVAGKEYGPEVDLWSLGIIFYGMVLGKLPFVAKEKTISSHERRKALVAQINKGLGLYQRNAMSVLSIEFQGVVRKLLVPNPQKRLTIDALQIHPWITEKGQKMVRTHPITKLDNQWKTKFTNHLCELLQVGEAAVMSQLMRSPYGRVGGMFNILNYKNLKQPFNIEKIAPDIEFDDSIQSTKPDLNKSKSVVFTKSHVTLYNQCVVLLNKVSTRKEEQRVKSAIPMPINRHYQVRPKTETPVRITRNKNIEVNNAKAEGVMKKDIPEKFKEVHSTTKRARTAGVTLGQTWTPQKKERASTGKKITQKDTNRDSQKINDRKAPTIIKPSRNLLANEPIARSIAGYLVKNVPNKMFNWPLGPNL